MNFKKYGRTAQLFDYQTMSEGLVGGILNSDGTITINAASSSWAITKYIPVAGREFTLQRQASGGATSICLYDSNQTYITGLAYNGNGTVTVSANTDVSYIRFTYYRTENTGNIMLNEGSTALPYEPHGNTWTDSHYIMGTSTDTLTTLPAELYPNAVTATVGLKGNMEQNGTPTPENPIMPEGTGERTGNLFDITAFVQGIVPNRCTTSYDSTTNTLTINATGADAHTGNANSYHIPVTGGETYTLSWIASSQNGLVYIFENGLTDSSHLHTWRSSLNKETITMQNDTTFIIVRVGCDYANVTITYTNIRLNVGETALPYEPYGYKIPISSASTTTPVYLGEVETTRKIKKLVLTGNETWTKFVVTGRISFYTNVPDGTGKTGLSSHFRYGATASFPDSASFAYNGDSNKNMIFRMSDDTSITEVADFKAWLAAQYANGTPVTIWYVLATSETGIVNEPLRKISDYADTVSGITIPTITGANSFDVLTTLKPSEVTANYHGWHTGAVHERDSGQWD